MTPFCNTLAVAERAAIREHVWRLEWRANATFAGAAILVAASIPAAYALGMAVGALLAA